MHDRSSLFSLPAEGIVWATNPATTLNPSFAMWRGNHGEVSRLCRASLRAGVARLLARSETPAKSGDRGDSGDDPDAGECRPSLKAVWHPRVCVPVSNASIRYQVI